ncbi:Gfo/Idh/MocA family oxidoreductase [Paenibacillus sp. HB172176]|uniref:Gfo/Idh/MocA family protein n=1 Tax=Paenibacillus sp. HB172176 TaxID=2493690 RepID=UPI00143B2956|nr:Gfo/Idh/MocA family oxidoreductase [Paenibacillus sp. HB172176]
MVKVAFVGAGGIAKTHFNALKELEHVKLTAVCDVVKSNAEKAAGAYGMRAYDNLDEMLGRERIDALFVCVPPFAHNDIEEKAAARGIHLLVEKPLGLDMGRVSEKADAIGRAGIVAAAGYCLRYHDVAAQARSYLEGKEIGMVRAHHLCGFVETPWWRELERSGGQLVEMATHTVDMVRYLAGDVKSVYGLMNYGLLEDRPGATIPSTVCAGLEFVSGAVGHVDTACIQPDWRSGIEVLGKDFRLALSGKTLTFTERGRTTTIEGQTGNVFLEQDRAFIEAVLHGDPGRLKSDYLDALHTLEISLAAYESARIGQRVMLKGKLPA